MLARDVETIFFNSFIRVLGDLGSRITKERTKESLRNRRQLMSSSD